MVLRQCCLTAVMVAVMALGIAGCSSGGQLGDRTPEGGDLTPEMGDPAPDLKVATWVKGGPVELAEGKGKTIYVVEFWATWCPPCRESIPHLTELQKKFKDKGVVFVGVSSEDVDTVREFVKKMGSKMEYAVAVDDKGETTKRYLEAWGIEGIPHAFVVDKEGRIAWQGHPMSGLGEVLDAMLKGEYDIQTAQLGEKAFELAGQYYEKATSELSADEKKDLAALGGQVVELAQGVKNAGLLNEFAWMILKDEDVVERDFGLALTAAKAAYDLTEGKDVAVVDTYAWALFENGKVNEAIEMEKSALALSEDEEERAELLATLEVFEKAAEGAEGSGAG